MLVKRVVEAATLCNEILLDYLTSLACNMVSLSRVLLNSCSASLRAREGHFLLPSMDAVSV
jgi:hypothetical protein